MSFSPLGSPDLHGLPRLCNIPLADIFFKMPLVAVIHLTLGWSLALREIGRRLVEGGVDRLYISEFLLYFLGSTACMSIVILKLVLQSFEAGNDNDAFSVDDVYASWYYCLLSLVELAAPLIFQFFTAFRFCSFEHMYTVSEAVVVDIAFEFDEKGAFFESNRLTRERLFVRADSQLELEVEFEGGSSPNALGRFLSYETKQWAIRKECFTIGERVRRRDKGKDWGLGYVTSVTPLKVTEEDNPSGEGYTWDEVYKMRTSDTIASTSPSRQRLASKRTAKFSSTFMAELKSYVDDINEFATYLSEGDRRNDRKLLDLPFIDSPGIDVNQESKAYAEKWAGKFVGERHPLNIASWPWTAMSITLLISLCVGATPSILMSATHPDKYLDTKLFAPKAVAVHSALCLVCMTYVGLKEAWATWSHFARTRCSWLLVLYLGATTYGRRQLYRHWISSLKNLRIRNSGKLASGVTLINLDETIDPDVSEEMPIGAVDPVIRDMDDLEDEEATMLMAPSTLKRLINHMRRLGFQDCELEASHWLDKKEDDGADTCAHHLSSLQFHVLDIDLFKSLMSCVKVEIFVDRVRLESCMLCSGTAALTSLVVITVAIGARGEAGLSSCIGIMSLWYFLLSTVYTIVSVNSAVLMNMALGKTTIQVLKQWKARIAIVRQEAQHLMMQYADTVSAQMRLSFDNKFRSLIEPFEDTIDEVQCEIPLKCVGISVTPEWRTRSAVFLATLSVGWVAKVTLRFIASNPDWKHITETSK